MPAGAIPSVAGFIRGVLKSASLLFLTCDRKGHKIRVARWIITKKEALEEIKRLKIEGAKHNRGGDQEVCQLIPAS